MKRHLLTLAFALAVALLTMPAVRAQEGCGYGYGGYWDGGYGWLYNTLRYEVPHFAAFPPVYYSVPVPRTYGYSPFAYPPNVRTPEIAGDVQPLTINNPYVMPTQPAAAPAAPANAKPADDRSASTKSAPEPLVILNPYVTQSGAVASSER